MNIKAQTTIENARAHLGDPYVFGAWGQQCTVALLKKYANMNPAHAENIRKKCQIMSGKEATCEGCRYEGGLAYDCRGFIAWLLKQVGIEIKGEGATSQWDTKANWDAKGEIEDGMPDCVCCVFKRADGKMKHTGMSVCGGDIIHCSNDVQTGRITDAGWTHWAIPAGLYSADEIKAMKGVKIVAVLRKGSSGEAVKQLQETLNELGYKLEADGKFGTMTLGAVVTFQTAHELDPDGVVGEKTWNALEEALIEAAMPPMGDEVSGEATNPDQHNASGLLEDDDEPYELAQLRAENKLLKTRLSAVDGVLADIEENLERLKYALQRGNE